MNSITLPPFRLTGLSLGYKTTNANGQSGKDCGLLWQQFEKANYREMIPGKITDAVYAVYYNYEGDYQQPFSYFIGCKVKAGTLVPAGLTELIIPGGNYQLIEAKGKMPGCIADAWQEVWQSGINRAYGFDIELYDQRSEDWNDAIVDLFVSVGSQHMGTMAPAL